MWFYATNGDQNTALGAPKWSYGTGFGLLQGADMLDKIADCREFGCYYDDRNQVQNAQIPCSCPIPELYRNWHNNEAGAVLLTRWRKTYKA